MNVITEDLLSGKRAREESLVNQALEGLASVFALLERLQRGQRLRKLHLLRQEAIRALLRERLWLCDVVIGFVQPPEPVLAQLRADDVRDPMVESNLCMLLTTLAEEYPKGLTYPESKIAKHCLRRALSLSLDGFLDGAADQAEQLAFAVCKMVEVVKKVGSPGSRVILLELPIGNSIPIRMLECRLKNAGFTVERLCISLSRNDTSSQGITRFELLSRTLDGFSFYEGDILLYPDEWCTGSNFKNICKLIAKTIRRLLVRVRFVPVALISPVAHEDPRFPRFLKKHEVLLRQAGMEKTDGYFIFPHMQSRFFTDGQLFWAERDRLAGYRKHQYHGSMFTSLDDAIEELWRDPEALKIAQRLFLEHEAKSNEITEEMLEDTRAFRRLFAESYRDYKDCRSALESIDHPTNQGNIAGLEQDLRELNDKFRDVIRARPARICVRVAFAWLWENRNLDYKNEHPFKAHVPVVRKLEGDHRLLHELLIDKLLELVPEAKQPSYDPAASRA